MSAAGKYAPVLVSPVAKSDGADTVPAASPREVADAAPRVGVTSVGEVANTSEPEPVSSVTAAARLAELGVPRKVATPVPNDVMPVPPLAGAKVPATVTTPCVAVLGVRPVDPKLMDVTAVEVAAAHEGAAPVLPTRTCPVVPAAVTPAVAPP